MSTDPSSAADAAPPTIAITGTDGGHFVNSQMLVSSWWDHNRDIPLYYCDYGLSDEQKREIRHWPVTLVERPASLAGGDGWRCKAGLIHYLDSLGRPWRNVIWIDADALTPRPLPPIADLMDGYDLLIDAHRQSVGEIVQPVNLARLPLRPADAYFSSGFWITSSAAFLHRWDELVERVRGTGNLWENDAFVAAAYDTRCRVRTICGNVWHVRGATSLETATLEDGELRFAGQPVRVLHANFGYTTRPDGRRIFNRPELRVVQDYYEERFRQLRPHWPVPAAPAEARPARLHALYVGHWAGNLGDSAVFDAFERLLPDQTELTCDVHTVGDWRRRPHTRFVSCEDAAACGAALHAADAAVLLGTTIVTDLHDGEWPIATVIEGARRAYSAGKPVYAVGVGVYPGDRPATRERLARELVPLVTAFTVRDEASRIALIEAGAAPEQVEICGDLGWLLDRPADHVAATAELAALGARPPLVAVNVVHEDWREAGTFYDSVADELDAFARETGCGTLFLCNEVRPGEFYDAAAARRVAEHMQTPAFVHEPRWMHPEEMVARLAQCELAVAMRYHFGVFASLAGVPWLGFGRGAKLASLLAEFGQTPVGPMGVPTEGRLLAALRLAWQERAMRRTAQHHAVQRLKIDARRNGAYLQRWLADVTRPLSVSPATRAARITELYHTALAAQGLAIPQAGVSSAAKGGVVPPQVDAVLAEMTNANAQRDTAIAHLNDVARDMSAANAGRDEAIGHVNRTLAEMSAANARRDEAIAELARRLDASRAELLRQIEDVRRRSLRVPNRLYQMLGGVGRPPESV